MARHHERQIDRDYRVAMAVSDLEEITAIETRAFMAAAGEVWRPGPEAAGVVERCLAAAAADVAAQARELGIIAAALGRAYKPDQRVLREEAATCLARGMLGDGAARREDWDGAMALLRGLTADPAGARDHVAWFQLGYLLWQHAQDPAAAAQAFARAGQPGTAKLDLYHRKSLRHLAHMHALRDDAAAALAAITPALADDHDTLFDAARHAARAGDDARARELLGRCADLRPTTLITMFAEPDLGPRAALDAFAATKRQEAEARASAHLDGWRRAAGAVAAIAAGSADAIDLPPTLTTGWDAARGRLATADHLGCVAIAEAAASSVAEIARRAEKALTAERDRREAEVVAAKREIAAAQQGSKQAGEEFAAAAARRQRAAAAAAPSPVRQRITIAVRVVVGLAVVAVPVKAALEQRPGHFLPAVLANVTWAAIVIAAALAVDGLSRLIARGARAHTPEETAAAARRDERTTLHAARRQQAEARLAAAEAAKQRAEAALAAIKEWRGASPPR